jgi:hypothetical protein
MFPRLSILLLALIPIGSTGCATLFAKGPDQVIISSRPVGAIVMLDGVPVGETPVQVAVPRDCQGVFTFELAGYQSRVVDVDRVVNGYTFLNFAWVVPPLWPMVPVGFLIDWATGDIAKFSDDPIYVELQPIHGG